MPEHSSIQLIRTLDSLRSALEPLSAVQRAINSDLGIRLALSAANRSQAALRTMLGPVEDLRRSGLFDASGRLASEREGVNQLASELRQRYRLPELVETLGYLQSPELQGIWKTLDRSRGHTATLQRAAASLTAPWLDTADALRSISGFCDLHGIGHQLREAAAFDPGTADRLRLVLGDWRDPVEWPVPIFTDPLARSDFYLDRGLDPVLTEFPAAAFEQIATSAGLKDTPPSLLPDYSRYTDDEDEEVGFERTNSAHDRLQRFETHMRRFIERTMIAAFGHDWIKQRVPPAIRNAWRAKRKKAKDSGEPERPLIAYADFTDYEQIILRKDNWSELFADIFNRPTMVQESFQRLYPIRICAMHARIVTQDDELYLYVETKRLLAAIGVVS